MKGEKMNNQDEHKYDDIINLPRPISRNHPPMPLADRAAQFAPFAALVGHEEAIKETARLTDKKEILTDEAMAILSEKLNIIAANVGTMHKVEITYFVPDDKKAGGAYVTHSGTVRKIDEYNHTVIMTDENIIPIEQIREIKGEIFGSLEE